MESEGGKIYPNLQDAQGQQNPGHYPPQGMNMPPTQQPTVVTQVILPQSFGSEPTNTICPTCQTNVTTKTSTEASPMAWVSCLLLFCFGCWPCACVPFCVCQKTKHYCSSCNKYLGESE